MTIEKKDDYLIYPISERRNFVANKRKLAVQQLYRDMHSAKTSGAVSLLLFQFQQKLKGLDREEGIIKEQDASLSAKVSSRTIQVR